LQIGDGDGRAHLLEEIEDGGARGIQADIGDIEIGLGEERGCGNEENSGRKIARDVQGFGLERGFSVLGGEAVNGDGAALLFDVRAEFFESEFGVVAGFGRLGDLRDAISV